MANPDYATTGLTTSYMVGSWQKPKAYRDPTVSEMDGGNIRNRRQPGDEVFQIQFDILYTNAQYTTFEAWIATFRGIGRFSMKVNDGSNYTVRSVQFVEPYNSADVPPSHKQVTFKLWVYP